MWHVECMEQNSIAPHQAMANLSTMNDLQSQSHKGKNAFPSTAL